jgi:hypothetical protein
LPQVTKEVASQVVVSYLKKQKKADKINVAMIEEKNGSYVVRGFCPIDIEGSQWPERFTLVVDSKGKVKSTDYALL